MDEQVMRRIDESSANFNPTLPGTRGCRWLANSDRAGRSSHGFARVFVEISGCRTAASGGANGMLLTYHRCAFEAERKPMARLSWTEFGRT
jgi:hypothetical protein